MSIATDFSKGLWVDTDHDGIADASAQWVSVNLFSNGYTAHAGAFATDGFLDSAVTTVVGTSGGDNIVDGGDSVAEDIEGGAGDDHLSGGTGDVLKGGDGADDIFYHSGARGAAAGIDSGAGDDRVEVEVLAGTGTVAGGSGTDTLLAGYEDISGIAVSGFERLLLPGAAVLATAAQFSAFSDIRHSLDENRATPAVPIELTLVGTGAVDFTNRVAATVPLDVYASTPGNIITGHAGVDRLFGVLGPADARGGDDELHGGGGNDELYGGDGNDTLDGGDDSDILAGDNGNDTLLGGGGEDSLDGDIGDDALDGGDGNDTLRDLVGNNLLKGGVGDDTLTAGSGNDTLDGGDGNDTLDSSSGSDTLKGGDGDDVLSVLAGSGDRIAIDGGAGNDRIDLSGTLPGATGTIAGGTGTDTLVVGGNLSSVTISAIERVLVPSAEFLNGTAAQFSGFSDIRHVSDENLATPSQQVELWLIGSGAVDFTNRVANTIALEVKASDFGNAITGHAGIDTLSGGDGRDVLTGGAGADWLDGGDGNDALDGGTGADTMQGGDGNDVYVVDNSGDVVDEGNSSGSDTLKSSTRSLNLADTAHFKGSIENATLTGGGAYDLAGNGDDNRLTGNAARNSLAGGGGNDALNGGAGADTMKGGAGNDTYVVDNARDKVAEAARGGADAVTSTVSFALAANVEKLVLAGSQAVGGTGNAIANVIVGNGAANHLSGGGGNDRLDGRLGQDTLSGGGGQDTFVFDTRLGRSNVDHIADFTRGDQFELGHLVFKGIGRHGALKAAFFSDDGRAHDGNDHILYNAKNGALSYDADGNGASHAMKFATVDAGLDLQAADFLIG